MIDCGVWVVRFCDQVRICDQWLAGWGDGDVGMASKWMWMHAHVCGWGVMCMGMMMLVVGLATAGE